MCSHDFFNYNEADVLSRDKKKNASKGEKNTSVIFIKQRIISDDEQNSKPEFN